MRSALVSGIVVGTLLSARAAHASCAIPAWVGAEPGTVVPTKGVFYVHDESIGWSTDPEPYVKLRWSDGEGTAKVVRVEETVVAIEYEGPPLSRIHVEGFYDQLAELVLDDAWLAPAAVPRVLQYWHHASSWTCSSSDTLMIQVDQPVAAFRVRWRVNDHDVDYIETPHTDGTKTVLELGKINCGGENVPLEQLKDGVGIELYAIRHDGSEVHVPTMPRFVRLDALPEVDAGMDHAFTIMATQDPSAATHATPRQRATYGRTLGAVILAFAGLGVLLVLWLIRRAGTAASGCSPAS